MVFWSLLELPNNLTTGNRAKVKTLDTRARTLAQINPNLSSSVWEKLLGFHTSYQLLSPLRE